MCISCPKKGKTSTPKKEKVRQKKDDIELKKATYRGNSSYVNIFEITFICPSNFAKPFWGDGSKKHVIHLCGLGTLFASQCIKLTEKINRQTTA